MKKLCTREVKLFAECLGFTEAEAKEVTDLFYKIKSAKPDCWQVGQELNTVDEYIDEWEGHWHRETNWKEYYEYEKEECMYCYGNTDAEAEAIFKNIESFKACVSSFSYELSNGLIIVVG